MNTEWTDSVTNDKAQAPDLTPVKITNKLTVPREQINITAYYLTTTLGHSPATSPRWRPEGIFMSINYIFTGYADLTMGDLLLLIGFMYQPGEVEEIAALAASVNQKTLVRLEYAHFRATHADWFKQQEWGGVSTLRVSL